MDMFEKVSNGCFHLLYFFLSPPDFGFQLVSGSDQLLLLLPKGFDLVSHVVVGHSLDSGDHVLDFVVDVVLYFLLGRDSSPDHILESGF